MAYEKLVLQEFKKYCSLTEAQISTNLFRISQNEYELWLNNKMFFSRLRDLHLWRLSQFMQEIWNFNVPTQESIAFIFQVTLASARSLIKDYKAQYGRQGYSNSVRKIIANKLADSIEDGEGEIEVAFQNNAQIDELIEIVRQISAKNPTISEPSRVKNRSYVISIERSAAEEVIRYIRGK